MFDTIPETTQNCLKTDQESIHLIHTVLRNSPSKLKIWLKNVKKHEKHEYLWNKKIFPVDGILSAIPQMKGLD